MDTKATAAKQQTPCRGPWRASSPPMPRGLCTIIFWKATYPRLPRSIGLQDTCQVVLRDPPASSPGAIGY
jgi:hypothetical protein